MTDKHLYFTDDFFTNFLINVNAFFKKSYLKNYGNPLNFFIGVLLILCLCLSALCLSYSKNASDLEEIGKLLNSKEYKISNRHEQLSSLSYLLAEKTSLINRVYFFPSWAAPINKSLRNALENDINNDLIPALVIFLENELIRTLNNGDINSLLGAFKVYLMIAQLEPIDRKYVKNWYFTKANEISLLLGISDNLLIESLARLDINILKKIKTDKTLHISILDLFDSPLLSKVIYNFGITELSNKPDINPVNILPKSFLDILSKELISTTISYPYTKGGYQEYSAYSMKMLKEITTIAYLSQVLDLDKLKESIQEANSMYISDYVENWNDLFLKFQFKNAGTLEEALHIIKKIQSSIPSIFKFLKHIDKEVAVIRSKIPLSGLQNSISEDLDTIPVNKSDISNLAYEVEDQLIEYKPLDKASVMSIQEKLMAGTKELIDFLSSMLVREDIAVASFELAKKIESPEESPITKVDKIFHTLSPPLDSTFTKLAGDIKRLIYRNASIHINQCWEETIYKFYTEKIQNKYPINPNNYHDQLPVQDFIAFFGKGGLLDSFVSEYLQLKGIILSKQTKELLKFAEIVRKYWFNGEGQPQIQFTIVPLEMDSNISKIVLSMLGEEIIFTRSSFEMANFIWPGKAQNPELDSAKINFVNKKSNKTLIYYPGSWAWYRFLELDSYNYVLSHSNSINNIIKSPLGDFEFSVTFKDNIPLLDKKNFFVPKQAVEVTK